MARKEALEEKIAGKYFVGIKATDEFPEQFFILTAVDLCDAMQQARRLFPQQTADCGPSDAWLIEHACTVDQKVQLLNDWKLDEICFLCVFRVPCEMQYWDSPKIISFYKGKAVGNNWSN